MRADVSEFQQQVSSFMTACDTDALMTTSTQAKKKKQIVMAINNLSSTGLYMEMILKIRIHVSCHYIHKQNTLKLEDLLYRSLLLTSHSTLNCIEMMKKKYAFM